MTKILIIGGVAGGASAAARARRLDEQAEIIVFDRGQHISFANCGLPYHLSGTIKDRQSLLLQTPRSFKARFNVDVRINQEVTRINPKQKTIEVTDRTSGKQYVERYDKLLLSPGATPVKPQIPGFITPKTFSLRSMADMDAILSQINQANLNKACVVGAGFIGLEMVEALVAKGIKVDLIELAPHVMPGVDAEMAAPLTQELVRHGVNVYTQHQLSQVEYHDGQLKLRLSNDTTLSSDLLISAVGVKPETNLASTAGILLGPSGGIKVNGYMQTNIADIYAVGDVVEDSHFVDHKARLVPLAGPANRQGRIAAENMLGGDVTYNHTQGAAICKVFDLSIAQVGLTEKQLQAEKKPFAKTYVHGPDHAAYYPNATPISFKLLYCPNSETILGAQAIGAKGVDKRIDIISVAQRAKLTITALKDLELCYAPPFGSAKDIVNQAAFAASNAINGSSPVVYPDQLDPQDPNLQLVDIRNQPEIAKLGTLENSINIPLDSLRQNLSLLNKNKTIIVICQVGLRGHVATRLLQNLGYQVKNLSGGFKTWSMFGYPIVNM